MNAATEKIKVNGGPKPGREISKKKNGNGKPTEPKPIPAKAIATPKDVKAIPPKEVVPAKEPAKPNGKPKAEAKPKTEIKAHVEPKQEPKKPEPKKVEGKLVKRIFQSTYKYNEESQKLWTLAYNSERYLAMAVIADHPGITPEQAFKKGLLPNWDEKKIRAMFNWLAKFKFAVETDGQYFPEKSPAKPAKKEGK